MIQNFYNEIKLFIDFGPIVCRGRAIRSNETLRTAALGQLKEHTGFLVCWSLTLPAAPPYEPQTLFDDTQKNKNGMLESKMILNCFIWHYLYKHIVWVPFANSRSEGNDGNLTSPFNNFKPTVQCHLRSCTSIPFYSTAFHFNENKSKMLTKQYVWIKV